MYGRDIEVDFYKMVLVCDKTEKKTQIKRANTKFAKKIQKRSMLDDRIHSIY